MLYDIYYMYIGKKKVIPGPFEGVYFSGGG